MDTRKYPIILFSVASGLWLVFGLLWLVGVPSQAVQANPGEWFVSQSGGGLACTRVDPCTLQMALSQAMDGDIIYMGAGVYTGSGQAVVTLEKSLQLLGGWNGAVSGTVVRNPTLYPTVLDGERQRRVIYINGKVTPTLDGLTIQRGNAIQASVDAGHGGGIYSNEAAPVIANVVITANLAFSNTDWGYGGGIYMNSLFAPAMITNCVFANNVSNAAPDGPGLGGGLYVTGDSRYLLTITGNSFQNNIAGNTSNSQGGALDLNYGAVVTTGKATLTRNVCQNNHASSDGESGFGGCIYAQFGVLTLDGNIAIGNTARYGTFLFESGVFTMTNNIVAQNLGGGVLTRGVLSNHLTGFLAYNTLAQNGSDGVFAGYYNSGYATLTLVNNIIVNHTTGIRANGNVTTNHVAADHTLFFGNEADTTGSTITNTHAITGSDPRFVDPTGENYHLSCLSPAVDAGASVPDVTIDIDGELRHDSAPDIGADEMMAGCFNLFLAVVLK